jgi:hypothetical protein
VTRPNWIKLKSTQQDELLPLLPSPGTWRLMAGSELPSVFPPAYSAKIDSALAIGVPTSTGGTYLIFSARRIDRPAGAIDIDPFGLIVHSTGPSASGVYLHHGGWEGRTQLLPPFWKEVSHSGIGSYYLSQTPEGLSGGTLAELPKGDLGAFKAVVREIRARVDGSSGQSREGAGKPAPMLVLDRSVFLTYDPGTTPQPSGPSGRQRCPGSGPNPPRCLLTSIGHMCSPLRWLGTLER